MLVRGIRGATTVDANTKDDILSRTGEMLDALVIRNNIEVEDIVSAIFSVTDDIDAEFPALAARRLGWIYTPLMCVREIPVPGSLRKCVRGLLHVNSNKRQDEIIHVYLYGAKQLRPDLDAGVVDRYYTSQK
jgi:chorismate mutase